MPENQGAAVVVETGYINPHLGRKIDIVDGKRVVRFDGLGLLNTDAGFFQRHSGGRHDRHRHVAFLGSGIAVGQYLDFDSAV